MRQPARNLGKRQTDAEALLWQHPRNRQLAGCKFRRQFPIGPYVADFIRLEKRLVVEVDGGHHMEEAHRDGERTRFLQKEGFSVLRFWNSRVKSSYVMPGLTRHPEMITI